MYRQRQKKERGIDRETDRQKEREKGRKRVRQTDRHTGRQEGRTGVSSSAQHRCKLCYLDFLESFPFNTRVTCE